MKREKRTFIALWLGIFSLVIAIKYSSSIFDFAKMLLGILTPFLVGGAMAFVVNVPMNGIEKHLFRKINIKQKRAISILLSYFLILLAIGLIMGMIVPQIATTTADLFQKFPRFIQSVKLWLENLDIQQDYITQVTNILQSTELNWSSIASKTQEFLQSGLTNLTDILIGATSSMIGMIAKSVIAFIFSLYILASKEKLQDQANKLMMAYFPEKLQAGVKKVAKLLYVNFKNFIKVQCLESCIIGLMFVVTMTVLRLPYAVTIGVLIAFLALIPVVGALIGCVAGAFMILIISPVKAGIFIITFFVIQQIEGNLIYPRVIGTAVGLPAMWTLLAVSVGGSLFGIVGMLAFIPLFSTGYTLLKEDVGEKIRRKTA